ncbi:ABC transporter permease [Eubacterium sp. 1001713B170207_170306_E7]|uniref:ABC transporter permease n=1 Tax=Eubacterium sp. 1001713B170207_170306_E7 TaxID=2787097 RepID=UPI0018976630|nr:ABC transporter permease [Eubacterium sp. 1001713B170207_170306_E7]
MLNVFCMEFKRLFKSRMVWILSAASLVVALLLCVMVVNNVSYGRRDDPDYKVGLPAIPALKEAYKPLYGAVTPEKLESAFETYIDASNAYEEKMPASVYKEKIVPVQPALNWIFSAFDDSEITSVDQVGGFYAQRLHNIENQLEDKYPDAPQAKQAAMELNSKVETPFNYVYGYGDTSPDIIILLLLVLILFCTAMTAPAFAADYHSRADDIQRCTRYGRGKLSAARALALLILVLAVTVVSTGAYLIILNSIFGWEGLSSSLQTAFVAWGIAPMSVGDMVRVTFFAGILTLLATASCSLFVSSRCKSPTTALIISFCVSLLPIFLGFAGVNVKWLYALLPSGGIAMENSFYYALTLNSTNFLHLGSFTLWLPYAYILFAAVEIPLFVLLTILSHKGRQVT